MVGILFAFLSSVSQPLQGLFNKKLLRHIPPHLLVFTIFSGASIILVLIALLFADRPSFDQTFWWTIIASGILNAIAHFSLQQSLSRGSLSRVFPFLSLTPLFAVLTSFLLLKEIPSLLGFIGILLIIVGLIVGDKRKKPETLESKTQHKKAFIFMTITAVSWALAIAVDRLGVLHAGPIAYPAGVIVVITAIFFLYLLIFRTSELSLLPGHIKTNWKLLSGSILMLSLGFLLTTLALNFLLASYVSAIKRLGILFGVFFGTSILKEEKSTYLFLGTAISVIGTILIALS